MVIAVERHAQEHMPWFSTASTRPGGRRTVHHDPFRVDRLVAERCRGLRRHIRRQQALDSCGHPWLTGLTLSSRPLLNNPFCARLSDFYGMPITVQNGGSRSLPAATSADRFG
jgi:hypothetical protein